LAIGAAALGLLGCGKAAPQPAEDAGAEAGAKVSLRDALVPLATACTWEPSAGMRACPPFDAFGHTHAPAGNDAARDRTARACLALVGDAEVKLPAATCARFHSGKDMREPLLSALEGATDRGVRLELALALKQLRGTPPLEPRLIALVQKGPPNDPCVQALLGALLPEGEGKEPSAEAFHVAKLLLLAPALNVHGAASGLLEAAPSRRAEYCAAMGQKVGADVRAFSWEGDWIFPRITQYPECDAEVARLVPVLVAAIKAFAEGERPAWALGGDALRFVGQLEDTRPLKPDQRKSLAAALDVVVKKGDERDKKVATELRDRLRK